MENFIYQDGKYIGLGEELTPREEYRALISWFNEYYTIHEQQYRRLDTLGDKTAYNKLLELYKLAEEKRARIQELETLI